MQEEGNEEEEKEVEVEEEGGKKINSEQRNILLSLQNIYKHRNARFSL